MRQALLFGFSAVSAAGAVVKILEYFKIGPGELSRLAAIPGHALIWGIALAVASAALFFAGMYFAMRKKPETSPTVEYLTWHGGGSRSLPRVSSGVPTWVAVRNPAGAVPTVAVAVTARLEFTKVGGGPPLIVPEARWYAKHISPAGNLHEGWRDSVDIDSEGEQSFILFVNGNDNKHYVYKSPDTLVGVLEVGRWQVKVGVTSDNAQGFEGRIGFLLTNHSLEPDAPAFTKLKLLKPRHVGVRPPAETLHQVPTRKRPPKQKIRNVVPTMLLEHSPTWQSQPREPFMQPSRPFRFEIALSFPGEYRSRVETVAVALAAKVGQQSVLYDRWHQAEFARPNLDIYLPKLYHEQSRLLVFFLCGAFVQRDWCGLEWRAGRDLLKRQEGDRLMFLRLDNADIPGLYSIDGYLDISGMRDDEVSVEILKRLAISSGADSSNPPSSSVRSPRTAPANSASESSGPAPAGPPTPVGDRIAEKQWSATDKLWAAALELRQRLSAPLLFFAILLPSEYDSVFDEQSKTADLIASINLQLIDEAVRASSLVENERHYLGEVLWQQFFIYRAFIARLAALIAVGKRRRHIVNWRGDGGVRQLLGSVFSSSQLDSLLGEPHDPHAIERIVQALQSLMLTEIKRIHSGTK